MVSVSLVILNLIQFLARPNSYILIFTLFDYRLLYSLLEYAGDGECLSAVREVGPEPDPVPDPPLHPVYLLPLLQQVSTLHYVQEVLSYFYSILTI